MDPNLVLLVIDEDFLLTRSERWSSRLRDEGRQDPLDLRIPSIKALSQYTVEEILEMGIDGSGSGTRDAAPATLSSRAGQSRTSSRNFREHGITVLTSMIVGFD